jgi:hypothetical protein
MARQAGPESGRSNEPDKGCEENQRDRAMGGDYKSDTFRKQAKINRPDPIDLRFRCNPTLV